MVLVPRETIEAELLLRDYTLDMNGFGCHTSEGFLEPAEQENVICQLISVHTSDQLQPLDLRIFANQDGRATSPERHTVVHSQSSRVNCHVGQITDYAPHGKSCLLLYD